MGKFIIKSTYRWNNRTKFRKWITRREFVHSFSLRDSWRTKASEVFIITVESPRAKHHRGKGKYTLLSNFYQSSKSFKSFNIITIVIATIMADKINENNNAKSSTEVSLKTPSDFQGPSNCQKLQSCTEFDRSTFFLTS